MRTMVRALAVSGALMVAASIAPAMDQGETPAAASASAPAPVSKTDIKKAVARIRRAFRNNVPCPDAARCANYFESFGVALTFNDSTIAPFAHEQRLERSGHDCIQEARAAWHGGNRALAVQWVMAAYMDDPLTRNWLADHPDAVVEALRQFGN